ncbi:hypothetical protein HK104_001749 [Borealophlyctis nickersoniae]|nr:hypothetical protein HK104_001749 [Borealophlyctis nickersoniae]
MMILPVLSGKTFNHNRRFPTPPRETYFDKNLIEADLGTEVGKAAVGGAAAGLLHALGLTFWFGEGSQYLKQQAAYRIPFFAGITTAFIGTRVASAKLREKDDAWCSSIAGFVAGALIGLRTGKPVRVAYSSIGLGFLAGFADNNIRIARRVLPMKHEERMQATYAALASSHPRDPFAERWKEICDRGEGEPYVEK